MKIKIFLLLRSCFTVLLLLSGMCVHIQAKITKKKRATFEHKTEKELIERKDELLAQEKFDIASKYLQRLMQIGKDPVLHVTHLLELADCLFELKEYKKAQVAYESFRDLYGGHDRVEYAAYREVVCAWHCTFSSDRDQTPTETCLSLCKRFLRYPSFNRYRSVIESIQTMCYEKLVESELRICKFYQDKGQQKAVTMRLDNLKIQWGDEFQVTQYIDEFQKNGTFLVCDRSKVAKMQPIDMVTRF